MLTEAQINQLNIVKQGRDVTLIAYTLYEYIPNNLLEMLEAVKILGSNLSSATQRNTAVDAILSKLNLGPQNCKYNKIITILEAMRHTFGQEQFDIWILREHEPGKKHNIDRLVQCNNEKHGGVLQSVLNLMSLTAATQVEKASSYNIKHLPVKYPIATEIIRQYGIEAEYIFQSYVMEEYKLTSQTSDQERLAGRNIANCFQIGSLYIPRIQFSPGRKYEPIKNKTLKELKKSKELKELKDLSAYIQEEKYKDITLESSDEERKEYKIYRKFYLELTQKGESELKAKNEYKCNAFENHIKRNLLEDLGVCKILEAQDTLTDDVPILYLESLFGRNDIQFEYGNKEMCDLPDEMFMKIAGFVLINNPVPE